MAEAHHDVGAATRDTGERGHVVPQRCDLDRLVDEGVFQAKRGRLEREPLAGAADPDPMFAIFALTGKHDDPGR